MDLANDCFQFVTGFVEIISISAPHIYLSALILSPRESIVHKLYRPQVDPLMTVIWGISPSWDPSIATARLHTSICATAWSPCSRFFAVSWSKTSKILILDAVTLEQLYTMDPLDEEIVWDQSIFSPDSHLLASCSNDMNCIISWDIQTGGVVSRIVMSETSPCYSMTFSGCGTMIGALFYKGTIMIYNITSGTNIVTHLVQEPIGSTIWTLGDSLQFSTMGLGSIDIWQINFTSGYSPTKVSSMSAPSNTPEEYVLHPVHPWIAFIIEERVVVWDGQHDKTLLDSVENPESLAFSSSGHFLACRTQGIEFYLWKESPDGYIFHQKFSHGIPGVLPLISPNEESIISCSNKSVRLLYITNSSTSLAGVSTQTTQHYQNSHISFSPDESLVAVAVRLSSTVTILDTKSGIPWLTINANTKICGLRITGDKIIVIGDERIVTWELPARNSACSVMGISNSVQTTTFQHPAAIDDLYASISPNLNYFAIGSLQWSKDLCIYTADTGKELADATSNGFSPGFTPDSHGVWLSTAQGKVDQWSIIEEGGPGIIKLQKSGEAISPESGFPWLSPCGHQIADDGWIVSSSGKRLLWIPPHWRPAGIIQREWSRNCLAVLHGDLLAPIIFKIEV